MKIAIVTVKVPFTYGGAEILVEMLRDELKKRGHQADIISIPFKWYPEESLVFSMNMGRAIDLTEVAGEKIDLVIATKFPAYYIRHSNKVLWLMHQHRQAYDLWDTKFSDIKTWKNGEIIRKIIIDCDNKYLNEYSRRYTIAENTSKRLWKYNGISSEVLYHPPLNYEKLHNESYGDYIFYPSRINEVKRQRLLVEAAKYIESDAKIVIAGGGVQTEIDYLKSLIQENHLHNKVKLVGFISEEEKISYYTNCLSVYFGAYDEDYGYITLEGMFSEKAVMVHEDAGGPLEFVKDGETGIVVDTNPKDIAKKIDELYMDKERAAQIGHNSKQSLIIKHLNWDYVIEKLLGEK